MTTGICLCSSSHREIPVMNTGSLQWEEGFPVMKAGFSPWELIHTEKTLFWPCTGLQWWNIFFTRLKLNWLIWVKQKYITIVNCNDHQMMAIFFSESRRKTLAITILAESSPRHNPLMLHAVWGWGYDYGALRCYGWTFGVTCMYLYYRHSI